jgi:hypothetical protein
MPNSVTQYILPTPAGAYFLAQDNTQNWQKKVLQSLFSSDKSLKLDSINLKKIFNTSDSENLKYKIEQCQKQHLIQVVDKEIYAPTGDFEKTLNDIICSFSNQDKALLCDSQGLCIANNGFPIEMQEEISVLSADIAIMHKRRALNINKKLGLNSQAWSIVDASGNSCLGFWPLNINKEVFVLVIKGVPFFNQVEMVNLVWALYLRYGDS